MRLFFKKASFSIITVKTTHPIRLPVLASTDNNNGMEVRPNARNISAYLGDIIPKHKKQPRKEAPTRSDETRTDTDADLENNNLIITHFLKLDNKPNKCLKQQLFLFYKINTFSPLFVTNITGR